MATLVHDDVLDRADLRRGRPTVFASRRARRRDDHRRPAVLARVRGARAGAATPTPCATLSRGVVGAGPRRARAARRRLVADVTRRALPRALRAEDRAPVRGGLPPRRARSARPGPDAADALADFGRRIGVAFQIFDDVLDVSGPVERTGKARGTDLLDGTVTLPLILARGRDADAGRARPASARSRRRRQAEAVATG